MSTLCPRDGHPRALVDGKQLDCDEKGCRCEECYRSCPKKRRGSGRRREGAAGAGGGGR